MKEVELLFWFAKEEVGKELVEPSHSGGNAGLQREPDNTEKEKEYTTFIPSRWLVGW